MQEEKPEDDIHPWDQLPEKEPSPSRLMRQVGGGFDVEGNWQPFMQQDSDGLWMQRPLAADVASDSEAGDSFFDMPSFLDDEHSDAHFAGDSPIKPPYSPANPAYSPVSANSSASPSTSVSSPASRQPEAATSREARCPPYIPVSAYSTKRSRSEAEAEAEAEEELIDFFAPWMPKPEGKRHCPLMLKL